jgi:hypothetical protein
MVFDNVIIHDDWLKYFVQQTLHVFMPINFWFLKLCHLFFLKNYPSDTKVK